MSLGCAFEVINGDALCEDGRLGISGGSGMCWGDRDHWFRRGIYPAQERAFGKDIEGILWVNRVIIFGRILACIFEENLGATRMVVEEGGNVIDGSLDDDPAVIGANVLCDFLSSERRGGHGHSHGHSVVESGGFPLGGVDMNAESTSS
jgi:hypothetical protein